MGPHWQARAPLWPFSGVGEGRAVRGGMAWWGSGVGVRSQGGGPALPCRALWWAWPGCLLLASLHTRRLSQGPKCTRPAQCLCRLLPPASTDPPAVNFITLNIPPVIQAQLSPCPSCEAFPILVQAEQSWLSFTWGRSLPWPLPRGCVGMEQVTPRQVLAHCSMP